MRRVERIAILDIFLSLDRVGLFFFLSHSRSRFFFSLFCSFLFSSLFFSLNGRITIDDVIRLQAVVFIIIRSKKRRITSTNRENNPSYSFLSRRDRPTNSSKYCQNSTKTCGNCQLMSNLFGSSSDQRQTYSFFFWLVLAKRKDGYEEEGTE